MMTIRRRIKKIQNGIYNYLLYLTNNEKKPVTLWRKDEVKFDIGFFLTGLVSVIVAFCLCIVAAFIYLKGNEKLAWCIIFLVWAIENSLLSFLPFWDTLRHNRDDEGIPTRK